MNIQQDKPRPAGRFYDDYLASGEWRRRRYRALADASYTCADCGGRAITAHHVTYKRMGFEKPEDLVALCDDCHRRRHGKSPREWR